MTLKQVKSLIVGNTELSDEAKKLAIARVRTTADNTATQLGYDLTELAYKADDEQFAQELASVITSLREVRAVIKALAE